MKRTGRLTALVLAACLLMTSAKAVNTYAGFGDVSESSWYYEGVKTCYENGVMHGTGEGNFSPDGVMTLAEAAVIAARLGASFTGSAIPPGGEGAAWYAPELDYLRGKAPELEANVAAAPERSATRWEFFALLAAVTPSGQLSAINAITSLPDTDDSAVLTFYNAGILTGTDEYGTFAGEKTLQRSEVAVTVARLLKPELRKQFVLQQAAPAQQAPDQSGGVVMTVDGAAVPMSLVIDCMNEIVYYNDYTLYQNTGRRLDWNADYGVGDLKSVFRSAAVTEAVRFTVEESKEKELGISAENFPKTLVPEPERSVLEQYAGTHDLLCAKHILVDSMDTAKVVLDALKTTPTLEQFNALLTVFGTDPGMASNPNGYLFSAGEMVPEFESAVRALSVGSYTTQPVQSDYGYHIIWRLSPADHPDLSESYRYETYNALLTSWVQQAKVEVVDQAALDGIDPQTCYAAFLASLSSGQ